MITQRRLFHNLQEQMAMNKSPAISYGHYGYTEQPTAVTERQQYRQYGDLVTHLNKIKNAMGLSGNRLEYTLYIPHKVGKEPLDTFFTIKTYRSTTTLYSAIKKAGKIAKIEIWALPEISSRYRTATKRRGDSKRCLNPQITRSCYKNGNLKTGPDSKHNLSKSSADQVNYGRGTCSKCKFFICQCFNDHILDTLTDRYSKMAVNEYAYIRNFDNQFENHPDIKESIFENLPKPEYMTMKLYNLTYQDLAKKFPKFKVAEFNKIQTLDANKLNTKDFIYSNESHVFERLEDLFTNLSLTEYQNMRDYDLTHRPKPSDKNLKTELNELTKTYKNQCLYKEGAAKFLCQGSSCQCETFLSPRRN